MRLKCEGHCQEPEGAVFCDGQYVDRGNNAEECVAALNAALDVEVEGSASSSGECAGGRCEGEAEAKGSAKCAVSNPGAARGLGTSVGLLALVAAAAIARRRRG
jgi:MYXO-CTERM domain-containing protein